MTVNVSLEDRFVGCLLGLAVGDSLGSHFEGQSPGWIRNRYATPEALIEHPPESPWHYTDDTQMAIGVAEALLTDHEIVESTLSKAFVTNYVPSRGYGRGARVVLEAMEDGQDYKEIARKQFPGGSFGNGAAMRVAPVGLFFHGQPDSVWEQARLSSLPTHVHPLGIEGAQLVASAVSICVSSTEFDHAQFFDELASRCETDEFQSRLNKAAKARTSNDLLQLGNGIAAQDSVVTAIGCFTLWPDSYEQVVANATLLGGDTDTIAAMAGAISGAYLGASAIPASFQQSLEDDHKGRSYITELARQLQRENAKSQ